MNVREFEVVIMVEVLIGEMVGSDPKDYRPSLGMGFGKLPTMANWHPSLGGGRSVAKGGCCGSTGLEIAAPRRSWRKIFCEKHGTDTKREGSDKKKEIEA